MASIRRRDTKPELALRKALRQEGLLGYRVDVRGLPGRPDIAFTRWRVAVFVDGVYWHGHPDHWFPDRASEYWRTKIARNVERDRQADEALRAEGWAVIRVWDLDVKADPSSCVTLIASALRDAGRQVR